MAEICDKCIHASVCGITHGDNLIGCIEFIKREETRKHGKWIIEPKNVMRCSSCGKGYKINMAINRNKTNFCPNCGSDNRGE